MSDGAVGAGGAWTRLRSRLFARSGTAPSFTARATGIPPSMLDAASEGALGPIGDGLAADGAGDIVPPAGRRGRAPSPGETVLVDAVGEKILGFWLQNRHQVLFPLTVNFRTIAPEHGRAVARLMAVALLAGTSVDERDRLAARDWLARAGADAGVLDAFAAAVDEPPALNAAIAAIVNGPNLTAYGYVVALVALGLHDETALFFLDYLAARLALPTNVVRSANRRYRR